MLITKAVPDSGFTIGGNVDELNLILFIGLGLVIRLNIQCY